MKRVSVRVLGFEVLALVIEPEEVAPAAPIQESTHNHSGDFALGFGGSPRPLPSDVEARR